MLTTLFTGLAGVICGFWRLLRPTELRSLMILALVPTALNVAPVVGSVSASVRSRCNW